MGGSLREFVDRVGRTVGGYNGKKTTENVEAKFIRWVLSIQETNEAQRALLKIYEEKSKIH